MSFKHIPVMLKEVVFFLNCMPGKVYVDSTLGGCGHAKAICEKIIPGGVLIGVDQDKDAVLHAKSALSTFDLEIHLFHKNFIYLSDIFYELGISGVDGILVDLGVSLHQLESSGRGFSFKRDEPLDMRMDATSDPKAEDLINQLEEKELKKIFKEYGEERRAAQIAGKIVRERKRGAIRSSAKLAQIVCNAVPRQARYQKIHPATRVFMALRIAVNKELERISLFMQDVIDLLNPKGRLCILAFHSLEDRIVKHGIKKLAKGCVCPSDFPKCVCNQKKLARSLTPRAVRPSKAEIAANPMARSTRLRALEKI